MTQTPRPHETWFNIVSLTWDCTTPQARQRLIELIGLSVKPPYEVLTDTQSTVSMYTSKNDKPTEAKTRTSLRLRYTKGELTVEPTGAVLIAFAHRGCDTVRLAPTDPLTSTLHGLFKE